MRIFYPLLIKKNFTWSPYEKAKTVSHTFSSFQNDIIFRKELKLGTFRLTNVVQMRNQIQRLTKNSGSGLYKKLSRFALLENTFILKFLKRSKLN